jgi:hypothetical protein
MYAFVRGEQHNFLLTAADSGNLVNEHSLDLLIS